VTAPLRVLLLEDSADDAELLVFELRQAGFDPSWRRVEDRAGYLAALDHTPDVILADYSLPQFTAIDALHLMRERGDDIPTIVVSGVMSEESCVEVLRHGAVDYLLKDRLTRLGPAVRHALAQQRLIVGRRRDQVISQRHQQRFRAAFDNAPTGMAVTTVDGEVTEANPALAQMTAYPVDRLRGHPLHAIVADEDRDVLDRHLRAVLAGAAEAAGHELRLRHDRGQVIWAHYSASLIDDPDPGSRHVVHQFLDITARRRAEQALQRQAEQLALQNAELQELDRLKNQFVATVSHELRTPLTSICGYTELLVDGEIGALTPGEKRIVDIIDRNGRRLLSLIEDLLTFARAEAGTLSLDTVELALGDLVAGACAELAPMADKAGVVLDPRLDPDLPPVRGDSQQLQRMLVNLLSNAVKFSPAGSSVTVTAAPADRAVTITVTDRGDGIPAGEQAKLFERFYRTGAARRREIPGTGLGLAITRAIVEAHGGAIALASEPGHGTTVRVRLPAPPSGR